MSRKNDAATETEPQATPAVPNSSAELAPAKAPPVGLSVFRALVGMGLRPRQAAVLAIYATSHPDLCADAMTPPEVETWAKHFQRENPHAWHAASTGDMIRFVLVTGERASEAVPRYQSATTELVALAHAA